MAKMQKAQLEAEFKHNTSIGANGEILYDAPIEIKDQADLDNYGITWDDCKTLNFHGSEKTSTRRRIEPLPSFSGAIWIPSILAAMPVSDA